MQRHHILYPADQLLDRAARPRLILLDAGRLAKVELAPIYFRYDNINYKRVVVIKSASPKPGAKFGCHSAANRHFGVQNSAVGRLGQIRPCCSYH
jgi:hypothetical protein